MFHILLTVLIALAGGGPPPERSAQEAALAPAPQPGPALVAEDQSPTGRFLTAAEVRPILDATRGTWIGVRDYNGQDLVYVSHLWAWRCGLLKTEIAINDGAFEDWPLPQCRTETAQPAAILDEDGLPYRGFAPGSVQSVTVRLTYDDLTTDEATFERKMVLIP